MRQLRISEESNPVMRYITQRMRRFCAFVTGFVFLASGILKLVDPTGAGLVMSGYFKFLHIGFLDFMAKPAGIVLAFAESITGTALITGVWRKVTACAAALFMGFFTLLTLLLVIFKPEMDCGCFGEAIHLTHLQTFIKNIVLCLLLACSFLPFRDFGKPKKKKYVSFGISVISIAAFAVWNLLYIPVADFTDYRSGAVLLGADSGEGGTAAENGTAGKGQTVFIYEKDGKRQTFGLESLPDSTWTFVGTENAGTSYGKAAPVLSFYDAEGNYRDYEALYGKVMAVSVYDIHLSEEKWRKILDFLGSAQENGFTPLLLVASGPQLINDELAALSHGTRQELLDTVLYCGYKTLITLNRSNGGAVYINDGMIVEKWPSRRLPDKEQLAVSYDMDATERMADKSAAYSMGFQGFLLYLGAVLLLV